MDDHRYINMSHITMDDLKHLAACDECAKQLADYVETRGLLTAPKNMKADILNRASQSSHSLKKRELFCYSLKVGFAAVFAITMLVLPQEGLQSFITAEPPGIHTEIHPFSLSPLHEGAQRINSILNEFKYQLFQREVSSNDK